MRKRQFISIFFAFLLLCTQMPAAYGAPEKEEFQIPQIEAKAALLIDGETGQILLEQNAYEEAYPASITKCMTALLVLRAIDEGKLRLDQTVTASQTAIDFLTEDSSSADIKVGEQLTVEQLLYCTMVQSANEACYILAEEVSGSVGEFVDAMNDEAKRLECKKTHFVNPCGLHDPQHYTCAWDVYLVVKEAMRYPMFMELAGTKEYTVPPTNLSQKRVFHTTNALLDPFRVSGYTYQYAKGIKTGHTSDAGYCLTAYAEKGDRSLISVVLGAQAVKAGNGTDHKSFSETKRMFKWGFESFTRVKLIDRADPMEEVPVALSRKTNYVVAHAAQDVHVLLPSNVTIDELKSEVALDDPSLYAPVEEGQKLGMLTVTDQSGKIYATAELQALNDVPASTILLGIHRVQVFFSNPLAKVLAVVVAAIVLYGVVMLLKHRKNRYHGGQSYATRRRNRGYRGKKR